MSLALNAILHHLSFYLPASWSPAAHLGCVSRTLVDSLWEEGRWKPRAFLTCKIYFIAFIYIYIFIIITIIILLSQILPSALRGALST